MSPLFERLFEALALAPSVRVEEAAALGAIEGSSRTLAELCAESASLGRAWREAHGDLRGRAVVLALPSGLGWVRAFLALLSEGAVVAPISRMAARAEVAFVAHDAGADLAVAGGELDALVPTSLTRLSLALAAEPGAGASSDAEGLGERSESSALLLYTSGTTGRPKGVPIRGPQLAAQTAALRQAWAMSPSDVLIHALPLHHLHGVVVALLTALSTPCSVILLDRFSAEGVLAQLGRGTVFMSVPTMLERLCAHVEAASFAERARASEQLRALRLVTSGSAALPVSLAGRWSAIAGCPPLERYGMTEIGMALSNPLEPSGRKLGHVGAPLPGVELCIVGERGERGDGPGELWVRGPGIFDGYHQRDEATREAFVDGWFKTGDVGERAPDGAIRLLGRSSVDILKSGGEKLSALEIEEVLREHPSVAEVAVVGLPDPVWGDRVVAVVVARPGAARDAEELRGFARARLAAYKVPKEVAFVESLPRNAMGKVQKAELAASLRSGAGA